jgi:AcrR family transcriptional regulator
MELNMVGVRQFDEDAVLDTALQLFWQRGYGNTSMPEIATATGVQRGSLYNAFGSKENLFATVFDRYRQEMLNALHAALSASDVEKAARSFFHLTIRSMTTGTPSRGCLTTKTAVDDSTESLLVAELVRGMIDDLETLLLERFSAADARPKLTLPPADAARLAITLTRGIVVMERVYKDRKRLEKTADSLLKILFRP